MPDERWVKPSESSRIASGEQLPNQASGVHDAKNFLMLSIADLFRTYLRHYADKNRLAIPAMLADDVHLCDWNISVYGKAAVLHETARNFAEAHRLEIRVLALY